jgi:uncharacterized membrane protein
MCMMMHLMGHEDEHGAHAKISQNESLLDILKRRYAVGEINKEQYEEMKRDLGV